MEGTEEETAMAEPEWRRARMRMSAREKLELWYYKYKVIFAVNVLRPWEAIIFNTFFFMLGALILYATFFRVLAVIRWLMNASAFVKSLTTPVNKCTSGVCSNPRVIT